MSCLSGGMILEPKPVVCVSDISTLSLPILGTNWGIRGQYGLLWKCLLGWSEGYYTS